MENPIVAEDIALPPTFAHRGVSLSLTTRVVYFARVRVTEEGVREALLPGLSGSRGTYVVPWPAFPEVISLSLHDRSLLEKLDRVRRPNPFNIRDICLLLQKEGFDGPVAAKRAARLIMEDEETATMTHLSLIVEALKQLAGDATRNMSLVDLIRPGALDRAKNGLSSFAREANASPGDVIKRLETWGQLALSLGTPDGSRKGFLARRIQGLGDLIQDLNEWMAEEPAYTASMAMQIADAAAMTRRFALKEVKAAMGRANRMEEMLINWRDQEDEIRKEIDRISWILDGWERILTLWEEVWGDTRSRQRAVVATLVQSLPILPEEVLNPEQKHVWHEYRRQQRIWSDSATMVRKENVDKELLDKLDGMQVEEG
ncbi:hypothetical protein [Aestuariispira insulae]|uniref:Uncharacterized protein n=1 Tax=Aestuariispira insulae TaxID=1461337 RepID=A0A3D9H5P4_9PROT|nr:hypothetical protein [Aestuariispira insulae]RED44827.1 hypothetical protein DFP90_11332 [Aestuariispira insulae]